MYEKQRKELPSKYFCYAPPMTLLDTKTYDRPKPPYPRAPIEHCSVYYYWWAFLRENEGYMACCERGGKGAFSKLYSDFGDVRSDKFFTWWRKRGLHLFCEPDAAKPIVHDEPPSEIDDENQVLVTIPTNGYLDKTISQVRTLLKAAMQERRQRLKRRDKPARSNAAYPVHTMPVLTSLHQTLRIWQAKKALPDGATLAEIGAKAGSALAIDYGKREGSRVGLETLTVWRCLKAAPALIHNVGQGRFPDVTPSPEMIAEAAAKKKHKGQTQKTKAKSASPKTPNAIRKGARVA